MLHNNNACCCAAPTATTSFDFCLTRQSFQLFQVQELLEQECRDRVRSNSIKSPQLPISSVIIHTKL